MNESVNINMLKKVFAETWQKATKQKDKERQQQAQDVYEKIKLKLEGGENVK